VEAAKILMMEGILDPALRELAVLKISALNQAEY
jgi:alkylhydroperoxidase family enzyme